MTTTHEHKHHHGQNLRHVMDLYDVTQEALALKLGDDWTQKKVHQLTQKEVIEPEILEQVARAIGIKPSQIENFDREKAMYIIGTTVNDHAVGFQFDPVINPVEKWLDAVKEIKELYERLLKEKDEKIALYDKLLGERNR